MIRCYNWWLTHLFLQDRYCKNWVICLMSKLRILKSKVKWTLQNSQVKNHSSLLAEGFPKLHCYTLRIFVQPVEKCELRAHLYCYKKDDNGNDASFPAINYKPWDPLFIVGFVCKVCSGQVAKWRARVVLTSGHSVRLGTEPTETTLFWGLLFFPRMKGFTAWGPGQGVQGVRPGGTDDDDFRDTWRASPD